MGRLVFLSLLLAAFSGTVLAGNLSGEPLPATRISFPDSATGYFVADAAAGHRGAENIHRAHLAAGLETFLYIALADTVPVAGNGLSAASDSILLRKDSVLRSDKAAKKAKKGSNNIYKDSVLKPGSNPRRATIYSAVFPGLGQIYNRKYWKLPLVYAAVGIPAYAYFYNKSWYKKYQYAVTVTVNNSPADSVAKVDKSLQPFLSLTYLPQLITNRDSFRKNQDYSVLFFLLFYGLQVIDATVDAHLKGFNVNDDLSLKITPTLLSSSSSLAGISFLFDVHKPVPRPLRVY